jgi:glycosyltransferase involved in cell wall biosynthesis
VGGAHPRGRGARLTLVLHVSKISGISGSESHLLSVLPALRERGWDVRMIVLHGGEEGARAFGDALDAPVAYERLYADVDPLAAARLVARFAREKPALVHAHLVHAHFHALPSAVLARVPVRVAHHHGFNEFRAGSLFAAADRAVARAATAHVAISTGLADYLADTEDFDRGAFEVVHYGIAAGPEPPPPPSEPRLLALGRLIPIKGLDVLFRAFARARAEVPALELDVAGEGPLRAELGASAPDGVRFLGRVSTVAPVLERALALVVPSRGEGFGMSALEAMERGRAVVASRVGGLPSLVADGETGLLVDPGDEDGLTEALLSIGRDPAAAARMGAAGRARALAEFPERRPADELDALYRRLLASR